MNDKKKVAGNLPQQVSGRVERHATAAGSRNISQRKAARCNGFMPDIGATTDGDTFTGVFKSLSRAHGPNEAQVRVVAIRAWGAGAMMDARHLTQTLGGKWHGRYGTAPCPVCQPEQRRGQNALTLADGDKGLLAHCKKNGCGFSDIPAAAGLAPGDYRAPDPASGGRREAEARAQARRKAAQAKRLWDEARPIAGTLAETYLRGRAITCALSPVPRFHPACWHGPTAKRYPALVEGGETFAVHRTYLRADGLGKAAPDPDKMMPGGVTGGAVRLTDGPGSLVVCRGGVETGLSLASGLLRTSATFGQRFPPRAFAGCTCHRKRGS